MSKIKISVESSNVGKVRIIKDGSDRIKNIFYFILLMFISIGFWGIGFKQLFMDISNKLDGVVDVTNEQIIIIVCNILIYLFIIVIFVPVIYNLKDFYHTVINNCDIYELNRERNTFVVNNKVECLIRDIEKVHLRIVHSSTGKECYRLYIKTIKGRKKLICQDNNYETLHELSNFIGGFLSVPVTIK
ncbi:MAG TPA: hypothetical protein PK033_14630 [Acetivibrio sp.]|nr:hypothetical protein [Clostridium sp.]HQA59092.1 hypothetical protein [Acetivibrio sp.]